MSGRRPPKGVFNLVSGFSLGHVVSLVLLAKETTLILWANHKFTLPEFPDDTSPLRI